jgi:hypothetical protein
MNFFYDLQLDEPILIISTHSRESFLVLPHL